MAKAALLVPYLEMCELARSMVGRYDYITPMCVEYTQTEAVEARAIELEQQGCKLIVARGVQAQLIKHCVKLPVVEIHVTAQELGVNCPKVGLIGFANMMCDTSQFDELFSVELMRYMVTDVDQLQGAVDRVRDEGCQAVIGSDMVCLRAGELGMVYRFIPSGEESMRNALDTMLFGNYTTRKDTPACMVEIARDGTLYLSHVEALSYELQYKLMNLIEGKFLHNGSNQPSTASVRIIVSSDVNLIVQVEKGEFRSDLYYALNVLSLDVPPLRNRREDILDWVNDYPRQWQDRYKRYISLTQGAQDFLENYDWPGNLNQVSSVCERIVLLAEKRSVDEVFLRRQQVMGAGLKMHISLWKPYWSL